jgi:hypothetical protein
LPTEPTPEEIWKFAETLDLDVIAKQLLWLKGCLDHAGDATGANSRNAALASLLGLIEFVKAIPQLGCHQIPPPALTVLHTALDDLDNGKVHPLLEKRAISRGQPVSNQRRFLRGCAAAIMDCLMQSGLSDLKRAKSSARNY